MEFLSSSWPWYVAGPLIGLMVAALLLVGNKLFGISSTLRDVCAIATNRVSYLQYDWRKQTWNLVFAAGVILGGIIAGYLLRNPDPLVLNPKTVEALGQMGVAAPAGLLPPEIFSLQSVLNIKGLLYLLVAGFLVGFGARWAGGCTSGHAITGLATLQLPSLIAVVCFFVGGLISANFIVPAIVPLLR